MNEDRVYICIDLKSFYASVECVERKLDPMTARLVVADPDRTDKTICLAVSPAMKALGVKNRCRVFEIPGDISYIKVAPRMQMYIDYSAEIYGIYLRYIAREDIHVYSIDEVFLDATEYLALYQTTARGLSEMIMKDILETTGIPAASGIGTNLYLAKIALDVTAKRRKDRIGELTEETYRETLWDHRPLTDFWRIGAGTARKLEERGIFTMEHLAGASEDMLYKMFGVDAELLIDHAWGRESATMADIKSYHSRENCLSSGQIFPEDYDHGKGKLAVKEMADLLCLELVERKQVTDSITLYIRYSRKYDKKSARGTLRLMDPVNSARIILPRVAELYDRVKDKDLTVRRVTLTFHRVMSEGFGQYNFFTDPVKLEKERRLQEAMLSIKEKYGKNAALKGMDLEEGATTMERNRQIGGHRSGA